MGWGGVAEFAVLDHCLVRQQSALMLKQVVRVISQKAASPPHGRFSRIRQVAPVCTPI